jgi:hypothetical protein
MIYSIDDSDIKEIPYLIGLNFGMKYKLWLQIRCPTAPKTQ